MKITYSTAQYSTVQYSTAQNSTVQHSTVQMHEDDLVPEHAVLGGDHVPQQEILHWPGQRGEAQDRVNFRTFCAISQRPVCKLT